MTPQLQQAIRLLQLSTLHLRQEIQQAVESNPLLELADDFGDDSLPEHDEERQDEELDTERDDALEELVQDEPGVETEWDDVYSGQTSSATASLPDDADEWQQGHAVSGDLQDHLLWQLNLTPMSDVDRIIAMAIIDRQGRHRNEFLEADGRASIEFHQLDAREPRQVREGREQQRVRAYLFLNSRRGRRSRTH